MGSERQGQKGQICSQFYNSQGHGGWEEPVEQEDEEEPGNRMEPGGSHGWQNQWRRKGQIRTIIESNKPDGTSRGEHFRGGFQGRN